VSGLRSPAGTGLPGRPTNLPNLLNMNKSQPTQRTISDAHVIVALKATKDTPEGLYGRRKMTADLRRNGFHVSRGTVDRLMRDEGLCGVLRGKDEERAGDLLNRDFTAPCTNRVWVADFTYCRTWAGFVYVAFIIDVFAPLDCRLARHDNSSNGTGDGSFTHGALESPA